MIETARWLRSPKGMTVVLLAGLAAVALTRQRLAVASLQLAIACAVAVMLDGGISALRRGSLSFPDSGLISGLFIGLILIPGASPLSLAFAAAIAIASKQIIRVSTFHLLNPAAAGLLGSLLIVPTAQSWWGALPDLPFAFIVLPLAGGLLVAWRVKKLAAVLTFLGSYFAAFTLAALALGPSPTVAAVFRPPFLNAAIFFGLLMVTDPATSPTRPVDQVVFGVLTAVVSAAALIVIHGLHYLFVGLLVANAWYAWRRTTLGNERREPLSLKQA